MSVGAGYFVRGEDPPAELDPRYDVVCVQWQSLWKSDWLDTILGYQDADIEVYVHTPFAYINPSYNDVGQRAIIAVLDETGGWLIGPDGERVIDPSGCSLIDPSNPKVYRGLSRAHVGLITNADWLPDGLFLDFIWDRVAWNPAFAGLDGQAKAVLDEQYRKGMYRFATSLKFEMGKAGIRMPICCNGWHRCTVLQSTALESFPLSHPGGHSDLAECLDGYYGKATWGLFDDPPMILPTGGTNVAYGIPKFRVVEAVAFASAFCPHAIVFDNSGFVFDVKGKLAGGDW